MSSIDPEATKELAADAAERGLRWVDSPLSGGIPKAALSAREKALNILTEADCDQQGNDRDHHQKLDERKGARAVDAKAIGGRSWTTT